MRQLLVGKKELEGDLDIPPEVRLRISVRATEKAFCYDTAADAMKDVERWGGDEVEIFGVWESACVSSLAGFALSQGMRVRIPKGYTWDGQAEERPADLIPVLVRRGAALYGMLQTHEEDGAYHYFSPRRPSCNAEVVAARDASLFQRRSSNA